MKQFDFGRFNGFMGNGLEDLLLKDLLNHDIFNESDLHSAAYFYIRSFFQLNGRSNIYVRSEPRLAGMEPDIVIFDRARPIYAVEFKFAKAQDRINEDGIFKDLDKLAKVVNRFDSMKWGFFYLVHDTEEFYELPNRELRKQGYKNISASLINARRTNNGKRRRRNYDDWREEWDYLIAQHREHAA